MKLTQYDVGGSIRIGMVEKDGLIPIDFNGTMIDLIRDTRIPALKKKKIPFKDVTFAPVVTNPSKIIGIGLNYMDHIRESKGEIPSMPLVFAKFPNTLAAHEAVISWDPELTQKVDFEAELAVIIGKRLCNGNETEAMESIFGYCCANDVSARDLQFGDGQWVRGKSLDSFCPLGPWIVTTDEIPDPHDLSIRCLVNGQVMQQSNTGLMVFKVPGLVSFLSRNFTLLPGDVILTGTPHGVGAFRDPSVYLEDGDEILVEIEKVGTLLNKCRTIRRKSR